MDGRAARSSRLRSTTDGYECTGQCSERFDKSRGNSRVRVRGQGRNAWQEAYDPHARRKPKPPFAAAGDAGLGVSDINKPFACILTRALIRVLSIVVGRRRARALLSEERRKPRTQSGAAPAPAPRTGFLAVLCAEEVKVRAVCGRVRAAARFQGASFRRVRARVLPTSPEPLAPPFARALRAFKASAGGHSEALD